MKKQIENTTEIELLFDLNHELFDCYCICDQIIAENGKVESGVMKVIKENIGLIRDIITETITSKYYDNI